jgi:hypothetical protein
LQKDISDRVRILEWMSEAKIEDFIDVSKVFKLYYSNPEDIMNNL